MIVLLGHQDNLYIENKTLHIALNDAQEKNSALDNEICILSAKAKESERLFNRVEILEKEVSRLCVINDSLLKANKLLSGIRE